MKEGLAERLARWVYGALLRLLTPYYLLRLWRRGGAEPLYRAHWGERLALGGPVAAPGAIWLHAVSLGETRAASALIDALRAERPGMRLLLTHGTATGREAGASLLRPGDTQVWLPYDTPGAVRRFFQRHRPAIGLLMETEIWPNLLHAARQAGVPMVSANARLSAKSARQGERFRALLAPAVRGLAVALAQTEADAERLRAGGVPRVEVMGNLKYDLHPDAAQLACGRAWRAALAGRQVLLFAVSREGEEAMLLQAWAKRPKVQRPLLLIVPRHPQRFDEVAALVTAHGLSLARRSEWQDLPPATALGADAWLGDSMREMPLYYGLAHIALLGGSFAPLGGQNLIEAAACGCPVVMGPHTFNFAEAAELALAAGAAQRATDMPDALACAWRQLADADGLALAAAQSERFAAQHRGAAARMAQASLALLQR